LKLSARFFQPQQDGASGHGGNVSVNYALHSWYGGRLNSKIGLSGMSIPGMEKGGIK
jgi:hypothetical protein